MEKKPLMQFILNSNLVSLQAAETIAGAFCAKEITKNSFLLKEGRVSDEYFFLEKGFMRAFVYNTAGNDVTTHFYAPGQVVFEVSSFFNRTVSKESIQATCDCSGWYISYAQLNDLFHSLPEFREFGRSVLVKCIALVKTRMLSMLTETAEQRYETLLSTNPEIFRHAPLKHIASYLGVTDTSLSRIRTTFSKK